MVVSMKKILESQKILAALGAVGMLVIVCVPLLIIAGYNYPQGDDLGYSASVHRLAEGGAPFWSLLWEAAAKARDTWSSWQGSFSACFLMALQPGVFGERFYGLGTWILIGSLLASELMLCRRIFGKRADRLSLVTLWALACLMQILFIPYLNEGFYWYNGSVYYTFFYSLSLFLCGETFLLMREGMTAGQKRLHMSLAVFLAFLTGGGNLATGLGTAVFLALLWAVGILGKKPWVKRLLPVLLVYLAAFFLNVFAPGNQVRQMSQSEHISAVRAVCLALCHSFRNCVFWCDLRMFLILAAAIPPLWRLTGSVRGRFRFPGLFTVASFLVYASQMAPISQVNGSYGPCRMVNIFWYGCVVLFLTVEGYWLGWLRTKRGIMDRLAGVRGLGRKYFGVFQLVMLLLWGGAALGGDLMECSAYVAYRSLKNGYAKDFAAEWEERLALLRDDSLEEVWLEEFKNRTEPLFYCDISPDSGDYFNLSMAEYYGKKSVNLKKGD